MSDNKTRNFEAELRIDASPGEVWAALTTPEGLTSWFAPEARVNPGENGTIWISWGEGMEGESRISAWEPNQHFAYTQDRPDRDPIVVDCLIDGQEGSTVLRFVQSGFGADAKFDDEYNSTSRAWKLFLFLLKHGLEHRHAAVRNVTLMRMFERPAQQLWESIAGKLNGGTIIYDDGLGCRCVEYPDRNHAVTGIFCEKCGGQTALTLMSILYDPAAGDEDRLRREWTEVADSLVGEQAAQQAG